MDAKKINFNDLPEVVGMMFSKIEHMEEILVGVREELDKTLAKCAEDHTPMTFKEACEFLLMKPNTLYYHVENGNIPGIRQGRHYIFYKDELIKWQEEGRIKLRYTPTPEELNEAILKSHKRKPNRKN